MHQRMVTHSRYSRHFQSEAATALSANKYLLFKLGRVSCTNYFMSIHYLRCSVLQQIKRAKRDKNSLRKYILSKMLMLQTTLCGSQLHMPSWPFCGRTHVI